VTITCIPLVAVVGETVEGLALLVAG